MLVDDGAGEVVKEVDGLRNVDGPLDFLLLPQPAKQWYFCQHQPVVYKNSNSKRLSKTVSSKQATLKILFWPEQETSLA